MLRPITEVRHRLPDRRAVELGETPRHTVTYYGFDWPVSLHFVQLGPDEKTFEWFNVGIELGEFKAVPGEPAKMPRRRFDPKFIRLVADSYAELEREARRVLAGDLLESPRRKPPKIQVEREPRRRRQWQGDDLMVLKAMIAEHRANHRSPAKELAKDFGVNVATAYRWIAAADRD